MLPAHSLIVLEYDPELGRMVPVSPEQMADETSGWTAPPEGMPAMWREHWQTFRKRAVKAGVPPDRAWYDACAAVAEMQRKWSEKARKRFFRR